MDELKPCPFCGGGAKIVYIDMEIPSGYVQCKKLCCSQNKVRVLEKAIEAWNRRDDNAATMREKTLRIIESRPEQIHAHLVIDWLGDTHCSNCGEDVNCTEPFCQHCGARLDEPEVKEY